jgi:hypothetical protein
MANTQMKAVSATVKKAAPETAVKVRAKARARSIPARARLAAPAGARVRPAGKAAAATPGGRPARGGGNALPAYSGARAEHLIWPLGGVGASLLAFTGAGGLDRIANRHQPDLRNAAFACAALSFPGRPEWARMLEGPLPRHKSWTNGLAPRGHMSSCGFGHPGGWHHGLPRMDRAEFSAAFPCASVALADDEVPVTVTVEAWSPFIPGAADDSGLPVAALTWRFRNPSPRRRSVIFSYHVLREALRERTARPDGERVRRTGHGFAFDYPATAGKPSTAGSLVVECDGALADCGWFRGGWFDANTERWNDIAQARARERAPHAEGEPSAGATLWLPLEIPAHGEASATVRIAWHEPASTLRWGAGETEAEQIAKVAADATAGHRPHYASRFADADAVAAEFRGRYGELAARTRAFAERLHAVDLPREALEAVAGNLPILRSPTVLRQFDGRIWAWEGTGEQLGSCHGTCTHVWNYAQAMAHLFPELERGLRDTEFGDSQGANGHQNFRAAIPIRPTDHTFHAAADGQLGGLVKLWRDWQISGDDAWLRRTWPAAKASLDYCIATWDPDRTGALVEPHHNTYDIEFWGPDGMCGSMYAAALVAAAAMAAAVGEDAAPWRALAAKAGAHLDGELFRGGRYRQQVMRATPRSGDAAKQKSAWNVNYTPEALALLDAEGPKYQYGDGVLSDGVIGAWMAAAAGLAAPMAPAKVRSHLAQVHRHNLKRDLRRHANPQRSTYALGAEGGLLLCTWPDGDKPSLPFVYSDEVWTGIEYQVASHCIMAGLVEEGLEIVRVARQRYAGPTRNPFDEFECGHWYARALASWALLQALNGVRYSAVERTLWIAPTGARRPYRAWLGRGGDFGTVTLVRDAVAVDLAAGSLAIDTVVVDGKRHAWGVTARAGEPVRLGLGRARR